MCADGTMNAQCSGRCSSQSCAVELAKQTMAFEDMIMSENVHYVLYFLMNVSVASAGVLGNRRVRVKA